MTDGDTSSDVLREFLAILDDVAPAIRALYFDREFYDSCCLARLQAHNLADVMPIVRWGPTIKAELETCWSRVIEHDFSGEVIFPMYIEATYLQGRYGDQNSPRASSNSWPSTRSSICRIASSKGPPDSSPISSRCQRRRITPRSGPGFGPSISM